MGLKFVVGDHQTYGFKGRSITSNVHTLRILSETAETTGLSAAVLQIDLSKAFDRVSHAFLFNMLEACGVGKRIAKYIKLCYKDISTRLLVNGSVTEKNLSSGLGQARLPPLAYTVLAIFGACL